MSGFTIPRLTEQNAKSVKNLERDIVLDYPKIKDRLPNRRELETKRSKWSQNTKAREFQIAKKEALKQKFKNNRQKILHNARLKAQEDLALNKNLIENQVSVIS